MHEPYQGLNHTVKMSIGNQTEKSAEIIFPSLYYSEMWPGPTTTVFCYTWIRGFLPSYYIDEKSSIVMICPTLIQLEDQDHCLVSAFLCSDDNQMVLCTRWLVRWTVSPLTAETCSQLSLIRQRQEGTQLMRLHLCFKGAGDGGGTPVCQPEL